MFMISKYQIKFLDSEIIVINYSIFIQFYYEELEAV
jgi:hypothetical protein